MKKLLAYIACGAVSALVVSFMLNGPLPPILIMVVVVMVGVILGNIVRRFIKK